MFSKKRNPNLKSAYYQHFLNLLWLSFFLIMLVFKGFSQRLPNIDNPVLPGVADAGVIKFNGDYYIGGVFTNGSFYHSSDLVNWQGPVHVFSMDNDWTEGPSADDSQIHANDINYLNGVFHQYWSVNYWGKDQHVVHIGHATAPHVLGPYKEPEKENWLDNRIDPELFIDDDGKPYLYMVKFTDGNTIWGRPMEDPWTFSGEPTYLFASLPATWETVDNRVAEGPWVIKYRGRYYLMYNTNHTSTRWGNYTLGVAEAKLPLGFNNGNKYPHPVVQSNQLELEDTFIDLLKYAEPEPGAFLYTNEQPKENWNKEEFNASSWQKGKAGFGSHELENSTTRKVRTAWETPQVWLRKIFVLDKKSTGKLMLRIHHDGETKVFLNGEPVYQKDGEDFISWNFDKKATSLLKDGKNVLAIHSTKGVRSNFLDVSLFDMKDQQADDILFSPGQPNILRGPNGFEWWLIYMANKNREKRSQYINRIHFYNKKLTVDALTGSKTQGYHPNPAQPTFGALFNGSDTVLWQSSWNVKSGDWKVKNKELLQTSPHAAQAFVKSMPATHYLFEAGVKMEKPEVAKAGVVACWQDEHNWLKVVLDQEHKKWAYILKKGGEGPETFAFSLPENFNYNVYHTLGIYKNADQFSIRIDDIPAPLKPSFRIPTLAGKGLPGLYAEGANTAFDGILYTIGWDEYDEKITGWEPIARAGNENGKWSVSDNGINLPDAPGDNSIFKGDMQDEYEISLQVTTEGKEGSAGIYPVYIDDNNYLKAAFDLKTQNFNLTGKKKGREIKAKKVSLERSQSYYSDMKYSDFIEKHFSFDTPTYIKGIKLNKTPHLKPDSLLEDIHKKVNIFYRQEGEWHQMTDYQNIPSAHPGFEEITFNPVKVDALKFVNRKADDLNYYVYKIWVDEVFRESYNLRVAKLRDTVIFLVDGKEVLQIKNDFPASKVGLVTNNAKAAYNGITFFNLSSGGRAEKMYR